MLPSLFNPCRDSSEVATGRGPMIRLLTVGILLITFSATSTSSAQTSPVTADSFLGEWAGTWASITNPRQSGEISSATISRDPSDPNRYLLVVKTNSTTLPTYTMQGEFKDGELYFVTPRGSTQKHKLLPDGKMAVDYFNNVTKDKGTWSVTRK